MAWLDLSSTAWLAFLGYRWTAPIFTLLALGEIVTDKLPNTPSREVPPQFGARIVSGGLCGTAIGVQAGMWWLGLLLGIAGAVVGTLGGSALRAPTSPAPSSAICRRRWSRMPSRSPSAQSSPTCCDAPLRRDRRRRRPGRAFARRALHDAGMTVAIVERHLVGGTCVNTGCKPTKTMVASAYAADLARRAADYGVTIDGTIGIDMPVHLPGGGTDYGEQPARP